MPGENTMENIALDVYNTLQSKHISIDTIIGHSFGGKVALEYMRLYQRGYSALPKTAIILDISALSESPSLTSLHVRSDRGRSFHVKHQ